MYLPACTPHNVPVRLDPRNQPVVRNQTRVGLLQLGLGSTSGRLAELTAEARWPEQA